MTSGWAWPQIAGPSTHVVDVLVFVNIPNIGSFDAIEYNRLSAYRFEGADGGTDPTGHQFLGGGENFF